MHVPCQLNERFSLIFLASLLFGLHIINKRSSTIATKSLLSVLFISFFIFSENDERDIGTYKHRGFGQKKGIVPLFCNDTKYSN
jgi:hypothetical protein